MADSALPAASLDHLPRALREALFSLSQNARLLTLTGLPVDAGVVVEDASGVEGINQPFRFEVHVLSPSAYLLERNELCGVEVCLGLREADGHRRVWHGIVTEAARLDADGGLARYRLVIESWFAWLERREDCYLFQDLNALGLVEALLSDWPQATYAIRVSDETRARLPVYRTRTQWQESDLEFLLRVLADDGLSYYFEHDAPTDRPDDADTESAPSKHRLVIVDRAAVWPEARQPVIRYHRSAGTEFEDSIHALTMRRQIGTTSVQRAGWNAVAVAAHAAQAEVVGNAPNVPPLEDYDGGLAPPPTSSPAADAIALRAEVAALAQALLLNTWRGLSSVRSLAPATVFTVDDHPDFDRLRGARGFGKRNPSGRFLVQSVRHRLRNNLHLGTEGSAAVDDETLHENEFIALPADLVIVAEPRPAPQYPGLHTALVVGIEGQVLTATRDHEVKVQFHWVRGRAWRVRLAADSNARPGMAGPGFEQGGGGRAKDGLETRPGNPAPEQSSHWLRVAQALAGRDYGEIFLPRIGDEVLIDFEQGDPDRPIVIGQLYNGEDRPPFAAGVDADLDHPGVISGLHTTTLDGSGYNELVFDDAATQSGVRAASSNFASQLNLGHLLSTRPALAWRGPVRGQGFEWTTDGWAVARAGQGLLLSTTLRAGAVGTVLDTTEAQARLKAARALTQSLSDAAAHQGARALKTAATEQARLLESLTRTADLASTGPRAQPPVPAFASPLMLIEAPASIAFATPATLLTYAGRHHQASVQGDAHFSAGKTVSSISGAATSLYSHSGGITAIAAHHPLSIQAHSDTLEVLADQSVTITSTDAGITVLANQKIVLIAGGAAITLDGENITFACPGTFSVKGAGQGWGGAVRASARLPVLPDGSTRISHWIALQYLDPFMEEPMHDVEYEIHFDDGATLRGTLDGDGKAEHEKIENKRVREVIYRPRPATPEQAHPALAQLLG